jgi:hypothetical protein
MRFGMIDEGELMEPFSNNPPFAHDDRPDKRIGANQSAPQAGQFEGPLHIDAVINLQRSTFDVQPSTSNCNHQPVTWNHPATSDIVLSWEARILQPQYCPASKKLPPICRVHHFLLEPTVDDQPPQSLPHCRSSESG